MSGADRVIFLLLVLLFHAPVAFPQLLKLSEYCRDHCSLCLRDTAVSSELIETSGTYASWPASAKAFHNTHVLLGRQDFDALGPVLLMAVEQQTEQDSMQAYLLFLVQGSVYVNKELYTEALDTYLRLLENYRCFREDVYYKLAVREVARIYYEKREYGKALSYYHLIEHDSILAADSQLLGAVYNNMSLMYLSEGYDNPALALEYQQRSLSIVRTLNDTFELATSLLNMGALFFNLYEDVKAQYYWDSALVIAGRHHYQDLLDDLYYNLSFLHEERGNFKKALEYRKKYDQVLEGIWNRDKVWELAKQEKEHQVALRERTIAGLEQEKMLERSETLRKQWQRNAFVVLSLLLTVMALFIWRGYRLKSRTNKFITVQNDKLSELNSTKDRLFSIITHDLRSPVLSLKRNNARLLEQLECSGPWDAYNTARENNMALESTSRLIENVLNWGISQQRTQQLEWEEIHLRSVVEQTLYDYLALAAERNIHIENRCDPGVFVAADPYCVKVALRNVIDNAIKYNRKEGYIDICEHIERKGTRLEITNSGVSAGREVQERMRSGDAHWFRGGSTGGVGLWLSREMIRKMGGEIDIFGTGSGTTVHIYFRHAKQLQYEKGQGIYSRG